MPTIETPAPTTVGPAQKLLLNVNEAEEISGLSRSRLYGAIADGSLHSLKVGKRRMFRLRDLEAFIESLPS